MKSHINILSAGQGDLKAGIGTKEALKPLADLDGHFFFVNTSAVEGADPPSVMSAMARIDDDVAPPAGTGSWSGISLGLDGWS